MGKRAEGGLGAVKRGAANPEGCSDEILAAPARGPVRVFRESRMVPVGADGFEQIEERYKSGAPGAVRDNFDAMTDQAARRGGEELFTAAQVDAGRNYRALHQWVQSAGVKCSRSFDVQVGGRGGVDYMDVYLRNSERLSLFHAAIGQGVAKDVRRTVPATQGSVHIGDVQLRQIGRKLITVRALVDAVCLAERPLSRVLEAHGWRATGKSRKVLLVALRAALGRMQGI